MSKPTLTVIANRPVTIKPANDITRPSPLEIARARFGRAFAHEPGSNFLRYPESVLRRWGRKANWRNVDLKKEKA